jgi:hypothetical protein
MLLKLIVEWRLQMEKMFKEGLIAMENKFN